MASPPVTPLDTRRTSIDSFTAGSSPLTRAHSRHSSLQAYSPTHSRVGSLQHASSDNNLAAELGGESLADELGGWESGQDEDEELEEDELEVEDGTVAEDDETRIGERAWDSGIDLTSSPAASRKIGHLNGVTGPKPAGQESKRKVSRLVEGSEYGSEESDVEDSQLVSASLEARLAAVDSLARRGTGDVAGQESSISKAARQFQDLGGQSGIENGSTRLTTAHTAIATHLTNQTRIFQQLTTTLLSPFAAPLSAEAIEDILPQIDATLSVLALLTPNTAASSSLRTLANSTTDLVDALSSLSDSVHMMRQSSVTASRRLRAVRDTLREWRLENSQLEFGMHFIEQGSWNQRLQSRECASVCHDVLSGFEQVCDSWRTRLFAAPKAESVAA